MNYLLLVPTQKLMMNLGPTHYITRWPLRYGAPFAAHQNKKTKSENPEIRERCDTHRCSGSVSDGIPLNPFLIEPRVADLEDCILVGRNVRD